MAKKSLTGMDKIVLIRSTQLFITPELKLILIIIASHMGGHDSICYASVRKLMAECDIRSRKIWDLRIEQLVSYNLITKFPPNERYRSNQYEIHFDVIDSIHNGLSPLWRGTKMKTKSVPPLEGEALSPLSLKNPVLCPPLEGGSKERYKEIKEKLLRATDEENKKLTPTDSSVPPGKMSSTHAFENRIKKAEQKIANAKKHSFAQSMDANAREKKHIEEHERIKQEEIQAIKKLWKERTENGKSDSDNQSRGNGLRKASDFLL